MTGKQVWPLVWAAVGVGCGGATGGAHEDPCEPNALVSCSCPNGASGTATCDATGTRLGVCSCDTAVTDAGTKVSASPDAGKSADARACSTDLSVDSENCGACAHSCLGGACSMGVCQPVRLAPGPIGDIAVDATNVYWVSGYGDGVTANGVVQSLDVHGGAPATLASGQTSPSHLVIDADNIYWVCAGAQRTILKVARGGGTPTTLVANASPYMLAIDSSRIYWTDSDAVMAVALGGGPPTTLATTSGEPLAIAVDATHAYWTGASNISPSDDAIMTVPLSGGAPVSLVAVPEQFGSGLVVANSRLFWTTSRSLSTASTTGGSVANIYGQSWADHVASDGSFVYWTLSGGWVLKAPVTAATTPTVLAAGDASVGDETPIAVDSASIYWGSSAGLMRLAK